MSEEISRRAYVEQAPPIIGEIAELVVKGAAYREQAITILHDTVRALKRAAKRAEALPEEFERIELVQSRGPVLEFSGKLLASDEFTTRGRDPLCIKMEVWLSQRGHYVAASFSEPSDRQGFETVRATVVKRQDDELSMRLAVMEAFEWNDRAKSMVRKQLGWNLKVDVDEA